MGRTGELAEDWRDVTKVLGSVGREVRVAELSIGEFGEAFEVRLTKKKKGVRLVVFTRNMKKSFFFAFETRRCVF